MGGRPIYKPPNQQKLSGLIRSHLNSTRYPTLELVNGQGTDCSNLPDTYDAAALTEYDHRIVQTTTEFKKTLTTLSLADLVDKCLVIVRAKASSGRSINERGLVFTPISADQYDAIATGGKPGITINKPVVNRNWAKLSYSMRKVSLSCP